MPNSEPSARLPLWVKLLLLFAVSLCAFRLVPLFLPASSANPNTATAPAPSADGQPSERQGDNRIRAGGPNQGPPSQADWEQAMQQLDVRKTEAAARYVVRSFGHENLQAPRAILQGRLFLDAQKLMAAQQAFNEAVSNSTYASIAQFWLGAVTYAMTDTKSAEQYWLQALQGLPNDPSVHRSLAMLYYDRGAIDGAVFHLQSVAKLDAKDARPLRLLGLIHKDYERYAEAAEYYRQALTRGLVAVTREQVRLELVECLLKTREYEEGLKVLDDASMTYDAIALKAECLIGLGRPGDAVAQLDELLAKDNQHFSALLARAQIHAEQREYPQAITLLRRATEIKSMDYLAHFRLAQCLRSAGQADEANTESARADEIKVLRERFSKLHQEANERPEDAEVRCELGRLAEKLKLTELAVIWYRSSLELKPDLEEARSAMERLQ